MLTHFLHILEFGKKNIQNHLDLRRGRERQSEIVNSVVTPMCGFVTVDSNILSFHGKYVLQYISINIRDPGIPDPDSPLSKKKRGEKKKGKKQK